MKKSFCTLQSLESSRVSYISWEENEWKGLKSGKNLKKASAVFSGKCHNSDILGKMHANLVNLYLNRRFMGGFYSTFSQKSKDLAGGEMHGFQDKIGKLKNCPKKWEE